MLSEGRPGVDDKYMLREGGSFIVLLFKHGPGSASGS